MSLPSVFLRTSGISLKGVSLEIVLMIFTTGASTSIQPELLHSRAYSCWSFTSQPSIMGRASSSIQMNGMFFFQAEDGIRDKLVTGFRRVLFRSRMSSGCMVLQLRRRAVGHPDHAARGHPQVPRGELLPRQHGHSRRVSEERDRDGGSRSHG